MCATANIRYARAVLRVVVLARWVLLVAVASVAIAYVGDDLTVRYRLMRHDPRDPFDHVTVYVGAVLENGKTEIFDDSPQTETCVRALFPHAGATPCWDLRRHNVTLVGS